MLTVFAVYCNDVFIGKLFSTEFKAQTYINNHRQDGLPYSYKELDVA